MSEGRRQHFWRFEISLTSTEHLTFRSIDTEPSDAQTDKGVRIRCGGGADFLRAGVEVGEVGELAVLDLGRVAPVH